MNERKHVRESEETKNKLHVVKGLKAPMKR